MKDVYMVENIKNIYKLSYMEKINTNTELGRYYHEKNMVV